MKTLQFFLSLCLANLVHSAELRLVVGIQIQLPPGLPTAREELVSFYGTNIEILKSPYLKARTVKNRAQDLEKDITQSIEIQVTHIADTAILVVKATGANESACSKYLSALVQEFLAFKAEEKKNHYDKAIQRVQTALNNAKGNEVVGKMLMNFRDLLLMAASLDILPTFEIWPEP